MNSGESTLGDYQFHNKQFNNHVPLGKEGNNSKRNTNNQGKFVYGDVEYTTLDKSKNKKINNMFAKYGI